MTNIANVEFRSLRQRLDPAYLNSDETDSPLVLRWINQRDSCWDIKQNLSFLDTVMRGWTCAPIYILSKDEQDCVFDGAHKIEALQKFVNGEYEIKKFNDSEWETSPLLNLVGKKYKDLDIKDKNKILGYKFTINYIPDEISKNPDALRILWTRLNNSGTPLNGFELEIPVYGDLHAILKDVSKDWTNTKIFYQNNSERGKLENELYQLLALSEQEWEIPSFGSLQDLQKKWKKHFFENDNKDIIEINKQIKDKEPNFRERLKLMRRFLKVLTEHNAFQNENEDKEYDMSLHKIELEICLGRFGFWFSDIQQFNIHAPQIVAKLKSEIFSKSAAEVQKMMDCPARNSAFQKKIINYIDDFLKPLSQKKIRYFTKEQRKTKLKEQNNKCALCSQKLTIEDSEADHILPFSQGGETTLENCQVVHKHCHRKKYA